MTVRVRYAPSPTGSPHVGNLRTAIYDWLFARSLGGKFITRLEDTDRDPVRYKPEAIGEIEASLRYLGIEPDEWWVSGGEYGPYVQSERLELYRNTADKLIDKGLAYRCYCTEDRLKEMREKQQASNSSSGYDRRCRNLSIEQRQRYEQSGSSFTVRLAVPLEGKTTYHDEVYGDITFENELIDDQVLLKSNGWPTYHLGVVVDDHYMGITHVIRGEDWMPSTPKQVLLYQALGWEQPVWIHVPLIVGKDKKKLSKRHGATQFTEFIRAGYLPEALLNFLVLLGWSAGEENRELFTKEELLERFSIKGIANHAAIFDYDKLRWMNGEYIRKASPERLSNLCMPYLVDAGLVSAPPTREERELAEKVLPLVCVRLHLLSDVVPSCEFFFKAPDQPETKGRTKWLSSPQSANILDEVATLLEHESIDPSVVRCEEIVNAAADKLGMDRTPIIHTLRVAVTGRTVGPGLFETLHALGRDRLLARLSKAKSWVAT